jgi:hypothetical protein
MKSAFGLLLFCLLLCNVSNAQTQFPFTSKENRDTITVQLINNVNRAILLPLHRDNYSQIAGAFWAMELMLYKPSNMHSVIISQFAKLTTTPASFQRSFLEMLYTLYPNQYAKELNTVWQQLASPKVKAMALEYLKKAGSPAKTIAYPEDSLQLYYYSNEQPYIGLTEDELLNKNFLPNQLVVVSFQYKDRNKPGYVMIRTHDHQWELTDNGKPFKAPQLARAISNMPWYLTNGNTPQGLYKLNGFDSSTIDWIGPTTNLQMQMPFESSQQKFFGDSTVRWKEGYANLLGSLASKQQLWQSFHAGKLGRSEIIAHGTAINPEYYKGQPYYPNTPSLGCLCSPEIWNDEGERVHSAQQQWIDKLKQFGGGNGYLIVAELKD